MPTHGSYGYGPQFNTRMLDNAVLKKYPGILIGSSGWDRAREYVKSKLLNGKNNYKYYGM